MGVQITSSVVDLIRSRAIRPGIGRVASFDDMPQAITGLAARETTGRVVVMVEENGAAVPNR